MKILNINKYVSFTVLLIALTTVSCDDFLNINDDPNNPVSVDNSLLLRSAQTNMAYAFGNDGGGLNSYASTIVHQYVQRGNLNDYGLDGTDFEISVSWRSLYAGALTDLNIIIENGTEEGNLEIVGVAQVMKAYIYATLVDVWGDVPYFEANQGSNNPFPPFDGGAEIYADVLLLLDEAIVNLGDGTGSVQGDSFSAKEAFNWVKVANTLKFRMYNNMNQVDGGNGAQLQALIDGGNLIDGIDADFEFSYGTNIAPENRNPGFVQEWAQGGANYNIDPFFFEVMRNSDTFNHGGLQFGIVDPRIPYYFFNQLPDGSSDGNAQNACAYCPSDSGTPFLSIYSYSFNIDPAEGFDQGRSRTVAGLYPVGGAYNDGSGGEVSNATSLTTGQVTGLGTVAQRLLSYDELLYMQAELVQLGQITVGGLTARDLLGQAIDASFAKVNQVASENSYPIIENVDRDDYKDAVLTTYDGATDPMEVIMTAKWVSAFGNGLVSYNDYRRTGYPRFHDGNTDDLAVTVQTRQFPVSFPYDITNLNLNPTAPDQRVIALDKVFWDN